MLQLFCVHGFISTSKGQLLSLDVGVPKIEFRKVEFLHALCTF